MDADDLEGVSLVFDLDCDEAADLYGICVCWFTDFNIVDELAQVAETFVET